MEPLERTGNMGIYTILAQLLQYIAKKAYCEDLSGPTRLLEVYFHGICTLVEHIRYDGGRC